MTGVEQKTDHEFATVFTVGLGAPNPADLNHVATIAQLIGQSMNRGRGVDGQGLGR